MIVAVFLMASHAAAAAHSAPWWAGPAWAAAAVGLLKLAEKLVSLVARSRDGDADREERVEVSRGRESTAQRRIEAAQDRGAFERAFLTKAEEHADCIREVKQLREEREVERRENAETIGDLRVELAECRRDHEHNARFQAWVRDNVARLPGASSPPAPRARETATPAEGSPRPAALMKETP